MITYSFTYQNLEYFLVMWSRIVCFIYVAPFFSMTNTPRHVRVGLSLFVAALLYQALPVQTLEYNTLIGFAMIMLKESMTGLLIGLGANLCVSIVTFAGHIADTEMGLAMATVLDPTTRENTTITGVYYNYMILLMLMVSGMHRYLLKALAETYILIPVNGAIFRSDALLAAMLQFVADYIMIGFRICLPIFAVMIILNAVLGVLAKVSPQMNMFAVGIQMKVLVGLSILFFSTVMLPGAADLIYDQMKRMVVSVVEALMP